MGLVSAARNARSGFNKAYGFMKSTLGTSDSHLAYASKAHFIGPLLEGQGRTWGGLKAAAGQEARAFLNSDALSRVQAGYKSGGWKSALDAIDGSSFNTSSMKRMGWYAGAGAAAGAGRSYYNGDGFGGYVNNMTMGAGLGAVAGGVHSSYATQGTYLNAMKGNWKGPWSAFKDGYAGR